ncbi:phage tail protein [Paenibacillus polysaccharolyticus]|uniref:tail fiber protein n=1 Tax=Paenibacillus polysaccharolyticus TaxID=582692 RepID=UPI00203DF740|nr:tail fiber protein [Paenibacillus polysaccharolyticus]MCM3135307.1 phage tail protein [Paenibacillus polysaccharolyticus]
MPKDTDRLNLPLPLGNENVTRESINRIFEKIDAGVATQADLDTLREAVSKMDIPDASLTQKGKVQLSNKTDGTSETMAATEKAVRDAATAAETNAKNASLPRAGGDISGPLTISSWGSISAGTSGFFLMGHNCYIHPTNNKYYYKQTHSNLGARGIIFRLGQAGVYTFETGPISTVKDTEFTPTLVRMPTQSEFDTLFQSVNDGKRLIETAIIDKGGSVSKTESAATFSELATGVREISTGMKVSRYTGLNVVQDSNNYVTYAVNDLPFKPLLVEVFVTNMVAFGDGNNIYNQIDAVMTADVIDGVLKTRTTVQSQNYTKSNGYFNTLNFSWRTNSTKFTPNSVTIALSASNYTSNGNTNSYVNNFRLKQVFIYGV